MVRAARLSTGAPEPFAQQRDVVLSGLMFLGQERASNER
jgi:hypothetical protein